MLTCARPRHQHQGRHPTSQPSSLSRSSLEHRGDTARRCAVSPVEPVYFTTTVPVCEWLLPAVTCTVYSYVPSLSNLTLAPPLPEGT